MPERGQSRTVVPVVPATPSYAWKQGWEWFSFCLLSSPATLLAFLLLSCYSSRSLLGPPGFFSFVLFPCIPQAVVPTCSGISTPWV